MTTLPLQNKQKGKRKEKEQLLAMNMTFNNLYINYSVKYIY